jgi:hypothetical protein
MARYLWTREDSRDVFGGDLGFPVYKQWVIPNGINLIKVVWAMRPNPRKPTFFVGELGVGLNWGPQNPKGDHVKLGH